MNTETNIINNSEVKSLSEIRSMAAMITSHINNMCNSKTIDEVVTSFVSAKDLLISIYKSNVDRVQR